MTQPQEFPAEPVPNQPAPEAPQASAGWAQQAAPAPVPQQSGAWPQQPQPQPGTAPVQAWPQPVDPAAAQTGQMQMMPPPAAFGFAPMPSPEEQAAAAEKKAKRRSVIGKSVIIAVPAVLLIALLAGTSVEASAYTSKTNDASTAAKAATAAGGLVTPLKGADSAAQNSILVDAGCVAVESQATTDLENKLEKDSENLDNLPSSASLNALLSATDKYLHDLQAFSTALGQDAALSKRSTVKTAIGQVSKDLGVVISAMQEIESGNFSDSTFSHLETTGNRIDGDSTAVDTMCGGTILNGGGNGDGASGLVA